jgi:hypothetical protein
LKALQAQQWPPSERRRDLPGGDLSVSELERLIAAAIMMVALPAAAKQHYPSKADMAEARQLVDRAQSMLPIKVQTIAGVIELYKYEYDGEDALTLTFRLTDQVDPPVKLMKPLVGIVVCQSHRSFMDAGFWIYFKVNYPDGRLFVKDQIPPLWSDRICKGSEPKQ